MVAYDYLRMVEVWILLDVLTKLAAGNAMFEDNETCKMPNEAVNTEEPRIDVTTRALGQPDKRGGNKHCICCKENA